MLQHTFIEYTIVTILGLFPSQEIDTVNTFGRQPLTPQVSGFTVIGASLSEPHTSESSGTSVVFTKIYVEIRIAWRVHKSLRLKSDYKPDNLQMLLVRTLITRRITRVVY